ncbi:hypothetical protein N8740_02750 [Candidatus Pelagibacter sp.]|jgi:hypothetical protein|nr:hypothetical protein [Candidatus Pelagibacter sp.]
MIDKKIFFFIAFSLLLSVLISLNFVNKLDLYESDGFDHHIIKGDIDDIWSRGAKFKDDLISGKNFLVSGTEIYRSYLPPRLIGFFSIIFDYELLTYEKNLTKISLGFTKFYYLLVQSLFFYLVVFYFYKNFLSLSKNKNVSFITLLFLCFCPNIFLYNSSFHTESIFFSLQLLLLTLLVFPKEKIFYNLIVGVILSLLFLQKTVGVFYFIIIITYLSIVYKKKSLKFLPFVLLIYSLTLLSIGYGNYKRMGVFYIMPIQGNEAIYHYLAENILRKSEAIPSQEISKKMNNDLNNWKVENGIKKITQNEDRLKIHEDNTLERDRIKIMKYKKNYTLNLIKDYPIITIKIMIWKGLQTLILDPVYIFHYHFYEQDLKKRPQWYMEKSYSNFWMPIKMIYSISIYLIILVGFFYSLRRLDLTFNFLLIISALYMFFMLGWVGTNRYFSTSLIYLSVYFAYGLQYFLNLELLKKYKFKK